MNLTIEQMEMVLSALSKLPSSPEVDAVAWLFYEEIARIGSQIAMAKWTETAVG